ncbi:hypothetical protein B0A58_06405 [Flavobacterium branchiophilum NBRC 15030 = ATCC 35035]|uniref:RNA-directed DNA polymerase n=1 Tax=Flavobacterium branchiophilum TaxID=55197 RepID=A0A543G8F4_9FLAO|nr:reverse transcriptase domain-containing protein [Flavobacterium branchiophilum]OXA76886.1 hypothetical protein B0A58_06405 [Flavobacterium branchiophilum NBRC 15030 = ATCC 35035]TQM42254.1 retron-type reverse transcriptase [Flavobacterium branchiophilum]GEM54292.1 hypothetical protein FB1_05130 [Flavobacterium branchiophilum NBRC 15030 = ATCC 35035]
MKTNVDQQTEIKELFQNMKKEADLWHLINVAKKHIHGSKASNFKPKLLQHLILKDAKEFNLENSTSVFYHQFEIKKKSGGIRTIHAPHPKLKEVQEALNYIFQCVYLPHPNATGFVVGKSIVDNAKKHVNQKYVYNLDLKDFFPSIDKSRVWGRLLIAPFNLKNSPKGIKIANMIASICCTKLEVERIKDGVSHTILTSVLPQGAPTSPTLTNAICEKMDIRLAGVAKRFGLQYSRYADDITFSSNHNACEYAKGKFEKIYKKNSIFDTEVRRIITDQNFRINESKVRLQVKNVKQEVTGITVNEKLNVSRDYIKQLRKWLYYWESYGFDKASTFFTQNYMAEKGHLVSKKPNMTHVLEGKLLYLKMVKGAEDSTYIGLKTRFEKLSGRVNKIDQLLDVWEKEGVEAAISFYNFGKKSKKIAPNEELDAVFNEK